MRTRFTPDFYPEVLDFLNALPETSRQAVYELIEERRTATSHNSNKLKKLSPSEIFEFRKGTPAGAVRILAFYDKANPKDTRMVCCHAFLKTTKKTPQKDLSAAKRKRKEYFSD